MKRGEGEKRQTAGKENLKSGEGWGRERGRGRGRGAGKQVLLGGKLGGNALGDSSRYPSVFSVYFNFHLSPNINVWLKVGKVKRLASCACGKSKRPRERYVLTEIRRERRSAIACSMWKANWAVYSWELFLVHFTSLLAAPFIWYSSKLQYQLDSNTISWVDWGLCGAQWTKTIHFGWKSYEIGEQNTVSCARPPTFLLAQHCSIRSPRSFTLLARSLTSFKLMGKKAYFQELNASIS